jgi:hypothetical protein
VRIPRVYADTSLFGGPFDDEFADASRRFFEAVNDGKYALVTYGLVEQEINSAPPPVQRFFTARAAGAEVVEVSADAIALRDAYVSLGIVSETCLADALHVALATVAACDVVVSWNFKHIVNYRRIQQYNAVNALRGYGSIAIYSPLEVTGNEDQDI